MKDLVKSISKKEWRMFTLVTLVVLVLTNTPNIYGHLHSTQEQIFIGNHSQTSADILVYSSYIKQAKDGHIFLKDYFTSERQDLGTFNIVWFGIGRLAYLFNLSPLVAFAVARVLFTPFLLLAAYLLLSLVFSQKLERKVGFFMLSFASGLGIYLLPLFEIWRFRNPDQFFLYNYWPIDLWVTESNVFNAIYQSPHFILSWTFLILVFLFFLLTIKYRRLVYSLITGLLCLIFFNFHPYYLFLVFTILPAYLAYMFAKARKIDFRLVLYFFIIGLLASFSVFYHLYLINSSYVIGSRSTQNVTLIYYFFPVVSGLGLLLPLAIVGLYAVYRQKKVNDVFVFLFLWLMSNLALLFLPTPFQSRYLEGLFFPLVVFSTMAIIYLRQYFSRKLRPGVYVLFFKNWTLAIFMFVILFCPSNIFNLVRDIYHFYNYHPLFYLDYSVKEAFDWLDALPQKEQVVLSGDFDGHMLPGFTGQKVYYGHGHETLNYSEKKVFVLWFYNGNSGDKQKKLWLNSQNIDYVFYSPEERGLGSFNPFDKDYLKLVYQNSKVSIFRVIR